MAVYSWGFNLEPLGSGNPLYQSDILIGYPFLFGFPAPAPTPVATYIEPNLDYFRNYILDLRQIRGKVGTLLYSSNAPVDAAINYFRKYLGKI